VGCDIVGHVENNILKKVTARENGAVSQGQLCIKGKIGFDFVHSDERILSPRIKKSFLDKNKLLLPDILSKQLFCLKERDEEWLEIPFSLACDVVAWKLKDVIGRFGADSISGIGGARTNCESGYLFQKFIRKVIGSPNIDNCARVCHAPSLAGMRSTIGEGAATNPFDDLLEAEFILTIGTNTTEGHPIVANRILDAVRKGIMLAVVDVRKIQLSKKATWHVSLPTESNLLFLNMLAYVILSEELYNKTFINNRCVGFEEYKDQILNDPYANPDLFLSMKGYEYITEKVKKIARTYASKRSIIAWGLGITEHIDGSYAVSAIVNLAMLTGNIGKKGAGLMPLRGQNNVQGTCDVGCLPYYTPNYQKPEREGLKTPQLLDAILNDEIKVVYNIGEDVTHIHSNRNKIDKAFGKLEMVVVQELFMTNVANRADIVFGVKSSYEKYGVYVNAERRMHLSQPFVENDLPDDWEVLVGVANRLGSQWEYKGIEEVWDETRLEVGRYTGASYAFLKNRGTAGLQWPVESDDTPILHIDKFRTKDGFGHFRYNQYELRGMTRALIEKKDLPLTLTTGRVITHYNNAAQTSQTEKLMNNYSEDILVLSSHDAKGLDISKKVVVSSKYGKSEPLAFKVDKNMKQGVAFASFHFAKLAPKVWQLGQQIPLVGKLQSS
jgi:formate dehydrogenase major subunit